MASICSMISFIVLLLAIYSYSVPLVPELQNTTSDPQVENSTGAFHFENLNVLVRREVAEERAVNDTVGLSSSSSEDDITKTGQTTEKLAVREMEDPSFSRDNVEREIDAESFDENERSFTEENHKREADAEPLDENERSFTEENFTAEVNTKRAFEAQSFESSTLEETSVAPSSEVKKVKRGSGHGPWLADQSDEDDAKRMKRGSGHGPWLADQSDEDDAKRMKRGSGHGPWLADQSDEDDAKRMKRGSGRGPWLADQSDEDDAKRVKRGSGRGPWLADQSDEDDAKRMKRGSGHGSWLADQSDEDDAKRVKRGSGSGSWLADQSDEDDAKRMKRGSGHGSWLADESDERMQKRSIEDSSVPSTSEVMNVPRSMEEPSSLSDEISEEFNRRAIGSVELDESSTIVPKTTEFKSTTREQPSTSTEIIREEMSSTMESETTVTPVDHFTRPSSVPSEGKSKILAIIPGRISKGQLVINPATGETAGFRPVHDAQLSQGHNQTITEEKKPNH